MALLACHTLRHSFNAREHARLQQRQAAVSLFVSSRPPAAQEAPQIPGQSQSTLQGPTTARPGSSVSTRLRALTQERHGQVAQPTHVEHLQDVIAANLPIFYFHPAEKYFPCTVEWFLERCQLALIRKGWRRQLLALLAKQGSLDGQQLANAQHAFSARPSLEQRRQFMLLQLDPSARPGQPGPINQIPIYAHVKEVVDPRGARDALEINYMKFLAYNGSYKPFGVIPAGDLGAHDADWEHVTVRLSPDAQHLLGVYYSAHRHQDGVWRSADEVPMTADGRLQAHVALDGHGSYPQSGFIPRVFFAFNDRTSTKGVEWRPDQVVVVTPPGKLPQVETRGSSLNGSVIPAQRPFTLAQQHARIPDHSSNGSGGSEHTALHSPSSVMQPSPWLAYEGRWGSSVLAPATQDWFFRAENPVSRTWLQQVLFPLMPGVESIWEPVQEQFEEAVEEVQSALDDLQQAVDSNIDQLKGNVRDSSEDVKQRYHAAMDALTRARKAGKAEPKHEEVFERLKEALDALTKSKDNKG